MNQIKRRMINPDPGSRLIDCRSSSPEAGGSFAGGGPEVRNWRRISSNERLEDLRRARDAFRFELLLPDGDLFGVRVAVFESHRQAARAAATFAQSSLWTTYTYGTFMVQLPVVFPTEFARQFEAALSSVIPVPAAWIKTSRSRSRLAC
jgi:hypothetical protein